MFEISIFGSVLLKICLKYHYLIAFYLKYVLNINIWQHFTSDSVRNVASLMIYFVTSVAGLRVILVQDAIWTYSNFSIRWNTEMFSHHRYYHQWNSEYSTHRPRKRCYSPETEFRSHFLLTIRLTKMVRVSAEGEVVKARMERINWSEVAWCPMILDIILQAYSWNIFKPNISSLHLYEIPTVSYALKYSICK